MSNLRLNALFDNIATNSLSRAQLHESGDVQNLHYGDIHLKYSGILNLNDNSLPYALKSDYKFKSGAELQTGDVVFADAAEDYEGIGKAVEIGIQGEIAAYAGLHTIHLRKKTDLLHSGYIGYLTQSPRFRRQIWFIAQGAKVLGISSKEVLKLEIEIPELSYQSKVVNSLKSVDHKINLLTKKKEALEAYKKGLMQKIFTQELRFKREDGTDYPEWVELRIGDISEERSVRGFNQHPLLSITLHNGIVPQEMGGKSDSSSLDKSNYKLVRVGDIGYNSMRMWQGASGVSSFEGIVSPAYTVFTVNKIASADFIGYLFKTHRLIGTFKSHSQGLTSDTWNLKYPMLKRIKINIPSIEEQHRIVDILKQIDLNLNKLDHRVTLTQNFKKGLLQQMFV